MRFGIQNIVLSAQKCGVILGVQIGTAITESGKERKLFARFRLPFDDTFTLKSAVTALADTAKIDPDAPINVQVPKVEDGVCFIQLKPVLSAQRVHVLFAELLEYESPLTVDEYHAHLDALGLTEKASVS